jgi:hypothetical protein
MVATVASPLPPRRAADHYGWWRRRHGVELRFVSCRGGDADDLLRCIEEVREEAVGRRKDVAEEGRNTRKKTPGGGRAYRATGRAIGRPYTDIHTSNKSVRQSYNLFFRRLFSTA